jgi:hypothetical protein
VEHSVAQNVRLLRQATKFTFDDVITKNDLELTNCTISSESKLQNLHISGSLILGQTIVPSITLSYSKIDRDVDLTSLQNSGTVDLTGVTIGRSLELYKAKKLPLPKKPWKEDAKLVLTDAKVEFLYDAENWWPNQVDVSGFTYERWRPTDDEDLHVRWGHHREWFDTWFKSQTYSPETYERLASAFVAMGLPGESKEILLLAKLREKDTLPPLSQFLSTMSFLLTGYGYHYEYSLYWCFALIILGTVVLFFPGKAVLWREIHDLGT